jgi:hypothetical protein
VFPICKDNYTRYATCIIYGATLIYNYKFEVPIFILFTVIAFVKISDVLLFVDPCLHTYVVNLLYYSTVHLVMFPPKAAFWLYYNGGHLHVTGVVFEISVKIEEED